MAIAWMIKGNNNNFVLSRRRATSSPRMISATSMEVSGKDPRRLNGALMYQIRLRWNREKLDLSSLEAPKLVVKEREGNSAKMLR
jgi:hypothetical protein